MKKISLLILSFCTIYINAQVCFTHSSNIINAAHPLYTLINTDFNNDGNIDIASASNNGISVSLGNGNGTFVAPNTYTLYFNAEPTDIVTADYNKDGHMDIAAADQTGKVAILLGNGSGSFPMTPVSYSVGGTPFIIKQGDFNNDGYSDLVTADFYQNNISVLLNTGTGTFSTPHVYTAAHNGPVALAVADLNQDHFDDVVCQFNSYQPATQLLLSNGAGGFAHDTVINFYIINNNVSILATDLNNDTKVDLTLLSTAAYVMLDTGNCQYSFPTSYQAGSTPSIAAVADFNNDGKKDLAIANQVSSNVSVIEGTGTGTFGAPSNFSVTASSSLKGITCADFNNDGKIDIATSGSNNNNIFILLNCTYIEGIENYNQQQIKIYPNPANNKITIDANDVLDVKLFDVLGKQITSTKTNDVDVSNFNDGVYFLQIKTNTTTTTQKIIVQH